MLKSKFSDQEKLLLKVDIDYYASLPGQQKASPLTREIKNDFHIYINAYIQYNNAVERRAKLHTS